VEHHGEQRQGKYNRRQTDTSQNVVAKVHRVPNGKDRPSRLDVSDFGVVILSEPIH
jgi:hypothetical protein